ncbi:MAG: large conductance mechanosensitive channel protein MscL [Alcaligenaceae bacterium]|nr:MAG: large conductance mechanosensitive channel protein MscL [Alcaligenaceae bacterium]
MLEEFKKFAMRGSVVDLAVGVIIGAAFGAIVSSMVGDLIMPIIGAVSGGLDFSNYYLPLSSAVKTGLPLADAKKAGAVLAYGNFITATLNFLIIAFVLFISQGGGVSRRTPSAVGCSHPQHCVPHELTQCRPPCLLPGKRPSASPDSSLILL